MTSKSVGPKEPAYIGNLYRADNPESLSTKDGLIPKTPLPVDPGEESALAIRERAYELSANRGLDVICTFMDAASKKDFTDTYRHVIDWSDGTYTDFQNYVSKSKGKSPSGRYQRLESFRSEHDDQNLIVTALKSGQMLIATSGVSQAVADIIQTSLIANDYRTEMKKQGWAPRNDGKPGLLSSGRARDTHVTRIELAKLGYTDIQQAVDDIANFADHMHTHASRLFAIASLFTMEQASIAALGTNLPRAKKSDQRPFINNTMQTLRAAVNNVSSEGTESLGLVVDSVRDAVSERLIDIDALIGDSELTKACRYMRTSIDLYMKRAQGSLDIIFGNAVRNDQVSATEATVDTLDYGTPTEVMSQELESQPAASEEAEPDLPVVGELDPHVVELMALQEYLAKVLQRTREPFRQSRGTLNKEFLGDVLRDIRVNFDDLDTESSKRDQAAYRVISLLHGLRERLNGVTGVDLQERYTTAIHNDAELAALANEVYQEVAVTQGGAESGITPELLQDAAWLKTHYESVIQLLYLRLEQPQAEKYISLLRNMFENDSWPQIKPVDESLAPTVELKLTDKELVEPASDELEATPPLDIDEELIAMAEELGIVVFPPSSDRYPRIMHDVLQHVPAEQQHRIKRWRMKLLENLATENGGIVYRTSPGTFGTKIPWYVAHIQIKGKHVAILEHPVEGAATYFVVNDDPKYWQELVSEFNRTAAQQLGAEQVIHPHKDSTSKLRQHKAKLADRMQDKLSIK